MAKRQADKPAQRVVFDTNVVLSALIFGGQATAQLRGAWRTKQCIALVSTATTQELIRALAYPKFKLSAQAQEELLADYLPFTTVVRIAQPVPITPPCRDPADLPFLQLATVGKAQALVTGDKDLLSLAGQTPFDILGPAQWLSAHGP